MAIRRRDPAFCFGVAGIAKAPWRPTEEQAQVDAIDAGFANWDEHTPEPGKSRRIYLHPLAEIWTTHELVPVLPREVDPPRSAPAAADDIEGLSRIERIIARREGRMR